MFLQSNMTYCVSRSIFLFSSNNEALALGGVQSALALDDGLAGSGATLVLGANTSDGVPAFAHDCCNKISGRKSDLVYSSIEVYQGCAGGWRLEDCDRVRFERGMFKPHGGPPYLYG